MIVLDALKTFLNKTQLRLKYSLETKKFEESSSSRTSRRPSRRPCVIHQCLKRCVLHETYSYALVIEMEYSGETDMSSINASDLDQPSIYDMSGISFCVKSL